MAYCIIRFKRHLSSKCLIRSLKPFKLQTSMRPVVIPIDELVDRRKGVSMPLVFLEKSFQLSICLRMSYASQNWLNSVLIEVFLETAVPAAVFMDSVSAKFAAMIHYQFPHGKKPPISID